MIADRVGSYTNLLDRSFSNIYKTISPHAEGRQRLVCAAGDAVLLGLPRKRTSVGGFVRDIFPYSVSY